MRKDFGQSAEFGRKKRLRCNPHDAAILRFTYLALRQICRRNSIITTYRFERFTSLVDPRFSDSALQTQQSTSLGLTAGETSQNTCDEFWRTGSAQALESDFRDS